MGSIIQDKTKSNLSGNGNSQESMESIGRKTTLIFIIKMSLTLSSFVGFFFVARLMGPEVIGIIGFALGFVGIFLQSDYGFGMAHNKRISEGRDLSECLGAYTLIKSTITSIMVALLLLSLFFWESILGHGFEDPIQRDVILVILVYYVLFSMSDISTQTFGGLRQSAKQQTPEFIGTFARMPFMIFVALAALGVVVLALSYILTGIIMLLVGFYMLRKFEIKRPSKSLLKSYVRFAGPIAAMSVITTISLNIDKVFIQFFWDSAEVGYFYGVQRLTLIMLVISTSLTPIFFPSISYYHAKNAKRMIKRLVAMAERYLSMVVTPMVVFFIVLATPIIFILLSNEFLPGTQVLIWLSFYCLIITLLQPYAYFLAGCDKPALVAKIGIFMSASNIALLLIFVPNSLFGIALFGYGAIGAAMATTISTFMGWVMLKFYSKKIAGIISSKRIVKHWVAGAMMGAILYFLTENFWTITRIYDLFFASILGLACYLGLLALMKEFRKKELLYFMNILNLKKMAKYIGWELRE
jgi:O-antigen/teichoic acid export membrane protein